MTLIRKQISADPIFYNGKVINEKKKEKWLGDTICGSGLKDSNDATIAERKARIYTLIRETVAILEDTRMNKLGGLRCGLEIFKVL